MTLQEFEHYIVELLREDDSRTAREVAELIVETLECHPEVVEKDPTDK